MIPTIDDVRAAADRLEGVAVRTPLIESPVLSSAAGGRILLKAEILQRTGSFKFRGAYNAISSFSAEQLKCGVVACSSGNHAQGVAAAAALMGTPATIVMPADAPAMKRERTVGWGAKVIDYDRASEGRLKIADRIATETGATPVLPFDDVKVIAGQGTAGLELVEQTAEMGATPDSVIIPVGGGGLAAGITLAVRASLPDCELYTAEPEGFDDHARSFASGTRLSNEKLAGSVCDALLSGEPGEMTFALTQPAMKGGLVVSDAEALAAVAWAYRELKLVVEPGGAVALAAVLNGRIEAAGRTIVLVLSGGNIDPALYADTISGQGR